MHYCTCAYLPVKRFRGGLVFKDHRLVCHSTLGSRVTKKKKYLAEGAGVVAVPLAIQQPPRRRPDHHPVPVQGYPAHKKLHTPMATVGSKA